MVLNIRLKFFNLGGQAPDIGFLLGCQLNNLKPVRLSGKFGLAGNYCVNL